MFEESNSAQRLNQEKKVKEVNFLAKNPKIVELEQSLINFLTSKKDIETKVSGGKRRVRGLTFNIDTRDLNNPYFSIQIGMLEALFNVTNGLKIRGNCFGLERFIRDWFERPSIQFKIEEIVKEQIISIKKANNVA